MPADNDAIERRFPRRFLLAGSAAVAAMGLADAVSPDDASAAPASTAWKLGGNSGVTSTGSNFLGPKNPAPLIFKTRKSRSTALTERMRIGKAGLVGIGTNAPTSQLDVRSGLAVAVRGTTTNTAATSSGVTGVAAAGAGVTGTSTSGSGVTGTSTNSYGVSGTSTNAYGLFGTGGYTGVRGEGNSYGAILVGGGSGSIGGYGSGQGYGLYGSGGTYGVFGSGSSYGMYGSGPTGIYGSGTVNGVTGTTSNVNGAAVYGTGGQYGVQGANARTAGVRGDSGYVGAWGQGTTYGVYGLATDTTNQTYGVFGQASNSAAFGIWSQGNAHVAGTLSKTAGSFKIDHPLDPDHRWLSHSFVESPDMMNVYNGNVVLDGDGKATVELPEYFGALNRDFRYQLTPIGAHAPVYISSTVKNNAFGIAGGTPGLEVSWQVTGIRQDAYAKEHPIVVDVPKSSADRGTRQFVPAGSSAKLMRVGPARTDAAAVAAPAPAMRTPTIR
jgi:hypothetical protein